jgi:hypothetical protein
MSDRRQRDPNTFANVESNDARGGARALARGGGRERPNIA